MIKVKAATSANGKPNGEALTGEGEKDRELAKAALSVAELGQLLQYDQFAGTADA